MTITKPLQAKRGFALLIGSYSPDEVTGEGTFLPPLTVRQGIDIRFLSKPVRAVSRKELEKTSTQMKGATGQLFGAFLALRDALDAKDKVALSRAKERMERVRQARQTEYVKKQSKFVLSVPPEQQIKSVFPFRVYGLPSDEAIESKLLSIWPDPNRGAKSWEGAKSLENASRLLSFGVSELVNRARLVVWWFEGEFRPAIYCEDIETAVYVHAFLIAPTGELGFRICPHCTDQFFQKRSNQDYCCPAHSNAHRVARSRKEKKLKEKETEKKRRTNGTQKAR